MDSLFKNDNNISRLALAIFYFYFNYTANYCLEKRKKYLKEKNTQYYITSFKDHLNVNP